MTTGVITELSDSDKDPGFYGKTAYGAGPIALQSIPLKLLLLGLKHASSGSLTVDTQIVRVYSETDVDTYAGAGGELARMAYAALKIQGVEIYIGAPAPNGSGVAATMTITIGGTWTTAGTLRVIVAGLEIDCAVTAAHSTSNVATNLAAAINAKSKCAASASALSAVVTLTWKSATTRGNRGIVFRDLTGAPSGLTATLGGGGSSVTGDAVVGNGITFVSGAGAEDYTNILSAAYTGRWHRIVSSVIDSTNLGRIETQLDTKAGPFEGRMEHAIVGSNGTLSAAASLSLSPMNAQRMQHVWMEATETPIEEIAAYIGALRTSTEQTTPNVSYSGVVIPFAKPQRDRAKWLDHSLRVSALNSGLTPLNTSDAGEVSIVRSITTRHQTSSGDPDDRTLDTSDAVVPDYVRDDLRVGWLYEFKPANPYVRDDASDEEKEPPAGAATPKRWNGYVEARLQLHEDNRILTDVTSNKPKTVYNSTAKRLASIVPTKRLPLQEQMEVLVNQL
jgi:phage tail sheath gpL-like